jgi:hypothetical protein
MANGITFVTPMPLTILIVFQFCCLKYRSQHSILIVAKSTQFVLYTNIIAYICSNIDSLIATYLIQRHHVEGQLQMLLLLHQMTSKASVDQHQQKSSVCANLALLEKENNSGYYTAQEGLSFTVVEQSATHPRSDSN